MKKPVRLIARVNQRFGTDQRSCVGVGSLGLIRGSEAMITAERLEVPVVRRECLGRCEQDPTMRIAPAGPFFTEIDQPKLPLIIAGLKAFIERQDGSSP